MTEPLLRVEGLTKHFPVTRGVLSRVVGQVRAVDDVSFDIAPGETLGLVGESGCGKTTAGRCVLRLIEPTRGRVLFAGTDVTRASPRELQALRRDLQVIFQDPFSSLNPRLRVVDLVGEALEVHGLARGAEVERRVAELLRRVGLSPSWINRYPHEFSGGQRQRIGIARAIALGPKLIVCDEAVSALDVSIQAQVINLLIELRREMGLAYLFIAHDLSVVRHLSHRVAVMYLGQLVEIGPSKRLFQAPAHPYTRALLSAIPVPIPNRQARRLVLHGDVPTPSNPPSGCRFHTRCPAVLDRCRHDEPPSLEVEPGHSVKCVHAEGLGGDGAWHAQMTERIERATEANAARSAGAGLAGGEALAARSTGAGRGAGAGAESVPAASGEAGAGAEAGAVAGAVAGAGAEAVATAEAGAGTGAGAGTESGAGAEPGLADGAPAPFGHWRAVGVAIAGLGAVVVVLGHAGLGVTMLVVAYAGLRRGLGRRWLGDAAVVALLAACLVAGRAVAEARRVALARSELSRLSAELEARRAVTGSYPTTLDELGYRLYPIFERGRTVDPWGSPWRYRTPGSDERPYDLGSTAGDREPSSDDIGHVPR